MWGRISRPSQRRCPRSRARLLLDCSDSGEQQRIALARLILKSPSLVLADEPTSALDHVNADLVMDILAEKAAHGALVLISTHSDHIARLCDRATSLDSTDNATEVPLSLDPPVGLISRAGRSVDGGPAAG
jgi:putative ABC transport system ATP-binding protein